MGLDGDTHVARLLVNGDDGIGVHRALELSGSQGRKGHRDRKEQK
jgi:hypothetical protein